MKARDERSDRLMLTFRSKHEIRNAIAQWYTAYAVSNDFQLLSADQKQEQGDKYKELLNFFYE